MKINQALARVKEIKPETVTDELLIHWLSVVDGKVSLELFRNNNFTPYSDTDRTKELLIPEPYTDIYIRYLSAMVDEYYNEIDLFNNDILLFSNEYNEYANHYLRTHSTPDYKI